MSLARVVYWVTASAGSAWLTWAAHRGPPPRFTPDTPAARPRPATPSEWAEMIKTGARLTIDARMAQARAGRVLAAEEFEGSDESMQPWMPTGIPDNPLVPGVGGIRTACDKTHDSVTDWVYCPSTITLRPGGLPPSR